MDQRVKFTLAMSTTFLPRPSITAFNMKTLNLLYRQLPLNKRNEITHHHGEPAVARHGNELAARASRLNTDGMQHRIAIEPWLNEPTS